jgi:hypothetical protein
MLLMCRGERVAQQMLAAEDAVGPLGDQQVGLLGVRSGPLGSHGQHVALHVEVDSVGIDAGQVEVDEESIATLIGVDRHDGRPGEGAHGSIDGKRYTAQEISARVLQKLKRDAEGYLGEDVTDAVITVPAYFHAGHARSFLGVLHRVTGSRGRRRPSGRAHPL